VIVDVRGRVVLRALLGLSAVLVSVHERSMVVLVHVVMGAVRELAERATRVLVSDVPMVVGVHLSDVLVLVRLVANDLLLRPHRHGFASAGSPQDEQQVACAGGTRSRSSRDLLTIEVGSA
jgi:hypothetical protein